MEQKKLNLDTLKKDTKDKELSNEMPAMAFWLESPRNDFERQVTEEARKELDYLRDQLLRARVLISDWLHGRGDYQDY